MSENTHISRSSVTSLTLGVLSIVIPFIGLILAIIGVVMSRKASSEGSEGYELSHGLATAGLICSLVGLVIQTLIIMGVIMFLVFIKVV